MLVVRGQALVAATGPGLCAINWFERGSGGTIAPRYGTYQQKTDREIPIVRLTREP